jgi:hypothetical protein
MTRQCFLSRSNSSADHRITALLSEFGGMGRPHLLREAHTSDQHIEPTDGELRFNAAVLVRPLSNRGAKSGKDGKEDGYEEETCAARIHKGWREGAARSFESEDSGCKNCEAHKALRRLTPPKGAQAWNPARSPALEGGIMTLFNRVFSTRTLLQIICVLITVAAMKLLSAHYDFSWAAAIGGWLKEHPGRLSRKKPT